MVDYQKALKETLTRIIGVGSRVALFDFPDYSNVGDSAIWLGAVKLLREDLNSKIVFQDDFRCHERGFPDLPRDVLVLINGGGNFGDLWPLHQESRERIISSYPDNRVIQLPQSIHFQSEQSLERCQKVMAQHKDFCLLVRDIESYKLGCSLHEGETLLCPDMALALDLSARREEPTVNVLGLLRTDKERVTEPSKNNYGRDFEISDWLDEPSYFERVILKRIDRVVKRYPRHRRMLSTAKPLLYNRLATQRLCRGCSLLSTGRVVITDRLHGHVLCTLLSIPHVVLDNSYGKISRFRQAWNTGEGLCVVADNLGDALDSAYRMTDSLNSTL